MICATLVCAGSFSVTQTRSQISRSLQWPVHQEPSIQTTRVYHVGQVPLILPTISSLVERVLLEPTAREWDYASRRTVMASHKPYT